MCKTIRTYVDILNVDSKQEENRIIKNTHNDDIRTLQCQILTYSQIKKTAQGYLGVQPNKYRALTITYKIMELEDLTPENIINVIIETCGTDYFEIFILQLLHDSDKLIGDAMPITKMDSAIEPSMVFCMQKMKHSIMYFWNDSLASLFHL
jgi:hypothetical protein